MTDRAIFWLANVFVVTFWVSVFTALYLWIGG
jgi:hypothetical protein